MPAIQVHKSWQDRVTLDLCVHVCWDMTHCRGVVVIYFLAFLWKSVFLDTSDLEDEGSTFFRNVGKRQTMQRHIP